jgi:hypothetical protein
MATTADMQNDDSPAASTAANAAPPSWWRRRSRWFRRAVVAAVVVLVLQPIVGFFGVPWLIERVIVPRLDDRIAGSIRLGDARFNPYTWVLELESAAIVDPVGRDALGVAKATIDFNPLSSLVLPGWRFNDIVLEAPFVEAINEADAGLNLAAALRSTRPPEADASDDADAAGFRIPRLIVGGFEIREGSGRIDDRTYATPVVSVVRGLTFRVENLDTTPTRENVHSMVATTDSGTTIEWEGTLSLDPPASRGRIEVRDVSLPEVGAYAARFTDVVLVDGRLSATVRYHLAPVPRRLDPEDEAERALDPTVQWPEPPPMVRAFLEQAVVTDVKAERAGTPLVAAPRLDVLGVDVDAFARSVRASTIALDGGRTDVERDADGALNLARMIRERPVQAAPQADPGEEPAQRRERVDIAALADPTQQLLTSLGYLVEDLAGAWSLDIATVDVKDHAVSFVDRSADAPVEALCEAITAVAGPLRTADGLALPFDGRGVLNGAPSRLAGTLVLAERTLDTEVETTALAIPAFAPYIRLLPIEPLASTDVRSGTVTARGRLRIATPDPRRVTTTWAGVLAFEGVRSVRKDDGVPVADAATLALRGTVDGSADRDAGVRAEWTGTVAATNVKIGPPVFAVAGAGEATSTASSIDLEGSLALARPNGGDLTGAWNGRTAWTGFEAIGLAAGADGATLDARAGSFTLDADLDLVARTSGSLDVVWKGGVELGGASADLEGGEGVPLDARLERFALDGDGTVAVGADRSIVLGWNGKAGIGELAGGLGAADEPRSIRSSLGTAGLVGSVTLRRDDDNPGSVEWIGRTTLERAVLARGEGDELLSVSQNGLVLEGGFNARLAEGNDARVEFKGTLGLDGTSITTPGARGVQADVATLAVDGDGSAALVGGGLELGWNATANVSTFDVRTAATEGGQRLLHGDAATLVGEGAVALAAERRRLDWSGDAKVDGTTLSLPDIAGTVNAVVAQAWAKGAVAFEDTEGLLRLVWTGTQGAATLEAEFADGAAESGGGRVRAALERVEGAAELELARRGEERTLAATTDITARNADVELPGDRRVAAQSIALDGTVRGAPGTTEQFSWKGTTTGSGVSLAQGSGATEVSVAAANLAFDGRARLVAPDAGATPSLVVEGTARAGEARASAGEAIPIEGAVASIEVVDLLFDEAKSLLVADRLAIGGFTARGDLDKIGPPSGAATAGTAPAAQPSSSPSTAATTLLDRFTMRLGELVLAQGDVRIDASVVEAKGGEPRRETIVVDQLDLRVADLSTDGVRIDGSTATNGGAIDLKARLVGSGRLGVTGTIDPFQRPIVADIVLTIDDAPLPPTNPIAGRYVGWNIERGRLSTRIPTTVQDGQVKGTLDFTLDSVQLAGRSGHPDAPGLPLDFALAIMRDSRDQVRGTIPFTGDATSPNFSLGGLIVQVILNFVGKVATAPFQLLASAFAGSENADLSAIAFAPGSATLEADGLKVVDLLVKALEERPSLELGVVGRLDREADGLAIRKRLLRDAAQQRTRNSTAALRSFDAAQERWAVRLLWRETMPEGEEIPDPEPPYEAIEQAMLARMPLSDAMLDELAAKRAEAVVAAILGGRIAESRVSIVPAADDPAAADGSPPAAQAGIVLRMAD